MTMILLLGGYFTADIFDVAPGPFTLSAPWPDPEPFPSSTLPVAEPQVLLELDEGAPSPSKEAVAELIDEFAADPFVGQDPGVLITDALTGQVLGELNPDEPKVPASTTKLLTAVAALETAGVDARLTTQVVDGSSDDPEAVTIVGGGDLTLDPGEGDAEAVIGHGGVGALAKQTAEELATAGRTAITDVVIDEGLWEGPRAAPRWADSDFAEGWVMPMSPLALDLGRVEGQMARTSQPAKDVGEVFQEALEDQGIEVSGEVRIGGAPDSSRELARVESAPLADLVEYMLVYSDNVLAEGLGRLIAVQSGQPASFEGAERGILESLEELEITTEGLRLADSSGLSSVNKISPRTLVDAMTAITEDHSELLTAVRGLPVAGLEGTLRDRMRESPAAGTVTGKTGSLRDVATIAAQVHTADGRLLHVAILTGGWDSSQAQARAGMDRLLTGLAECGCSDAGE